MQLLDDRLVLSASDLTGFAACHHLAQLELGAARGEWERAKREDPMLDVLSRRGGEHEAKHLARFRAEGLTVVEIDEIPYDNDADATRANLAAAEAATLAAMRRGHDVIYQATFFDGRWRGHADFLLKVDTPSPVLGAWSYEVADTKLARRVKAAALLQMCHYSEHVDRLQGVAPVHMHVVTGDGETHTEKVRDYAAYYRHLERRFESVVGVSDGGAVSTKPRTGVEGVAHTDSRDAGSSAAGVRQVSVPADTYPDPVEHCGVCRWADVCSDRRRADDHLSLVAGIRSDQTRKLVAAGIPTRTALGRAEPDTVVDGVRAATFQKLQAQARLQVDGEGEVPQRYELLQPERPAPIRLTPEQADALDTAGAPDDLRALAAGDAPWPKRGFAALPEPSPGDLFFDMEGDPYALDDGSGLEYLFGVTALGADGSPQYHPFWAHTRAEEKAAFEGFIDFVMARLDEHPDLHVYHYAFYEPSRIRHLMGLHGTREREVDELLRGERFVDLFAVVRQGVRIGTESYGLKQVEKLYMRRAVGEVAEGAASIVAYEDYLEDGSQHRLDEIEHYNAEDCRSTLELRDWLEARRVDAEAQFGPIPRPVLRDGQASAELTERDAHIEALADRLLRRVPARADERSDEEQGRWLLAQLLSWHRREDKPDWWSYYHRVSYENDDDFLADRECIGGLRYVRDVGEVDRSLACEYAFEPQDHKFKAYAKPVDPATGKGAGEILFVDDALGLLHLKRSSQQQALGHPRALIPQTPINSRTLRDAVVRVGESVAEHRLRDDRGLTYRAARDLLAHRPPRLVGAASLVIDGETGRDAARRVVHLLDDTYLAIQGPPGSGKTTLGAALIVDLVEAGKRVGVTAHSHAVIGNLLDAVVREADRRNAARKRRQRRPVRVMQKAKEHEACESESVRVVDDNGDVRAALAEQDVDVIGGTAWLWARGDMTRAVDVLFVDEAGQKSLADVIAMSGAAGSIVLLGDPQQLAQPSHGSHPAGAEVSALEHVIGGHPTMPEEYGLFLATSHRMHPAICEFVSEIAYDDKLRAEDGNERQTVAGEAGLRWVPVEHQGNRSSSPEEAAAVATLVDELVGKPCVDRHGQVHELTVDDILVVTPYNAQVAKLSAALPEGARVGTVDKFQGREAPVVIYSLATSSAEDVPRSMEFLYDLHRLNVAVSRAQALTYVVASPALLDVGCRTPAQLGEVSAFCGYVDVERGCDLP